MSPIYSIDCLCPTGGLGGYGFVIHLSPEFKEAVKRSGINQESADHVIKTFGLEWLQKCGFSDYFDIENCGYTKEQRELPSLETRPLYTYREIRIRWGEWGLEHISIPGNACGLDIGGNFGCVFENGQLLTPHNVDSWNQVNLLLIIFTWFAHSMTLEAINRQIKI